MTIDYCGNYLVCTELFSHWFHFYDAFLILNDSGWNVSLSAGITVDKYGVIFFVDGTMIRRIDQNGIISTLLGFNDLTSARPLSCDAVMDISQVRPFWPLACDLPSVPITALLSQPSCTRKYVVFVNYQAIRKYFLCKGPLFIYYLCQALASPFPS